MQVYARFDRNQLDVCQATAAARITGLPSRDAKWLIENNMTQLSDFIESRFELMGELRTQRLVTAREWDKLRAIVSVYERNDALLEMMCTKTQEECHMPRGATNNGQECCIDIDDRLNYCRTDMVYFATKR